MADLEINIRKALKEDGDDLCKIIDASGKNANINSLPPDAEERLKNDLLGESPKADAYLAECDGSVVGYAVVFYTYSTSLAKPTLFIEDIFVLPSYRGKGVGRALYKHCAETTIKEGCGRMEWVVLSENDDIMQFYEKYGAKK